MHTSRLRPRGCFLMEHERSVLFSLKSQIVSSKEAGTRVFLAPTKPGAIPCTTEVLDIYSVTNGFYFMSICNGLLNKCDFKVC